MAFLSSAPGRRDVSEWQRSLMWLCFIALVVVVMYRTSFSFGFVFDDHEQIETNPALRSWAGLHVAVAQQFWARSRVAGAYYRPLFVFWSYLNFLCFNTRPFGWHVVGVLLHALASCSVFVLARKLKLESWIAGIAALLFAVHPVHVEVVSWVSSSSDSLATIFFVFGFVAYLKARESGEHKLIGWWLLSLLLAACAVFTKEIGVTFPAIVFSYAWITSHGQSLYSRVRISVLSALPFAGIDAGYLVARSAALHGLAMRVPHRGVGELLLTFPTVLELYVKLLVFPVGLNTFYYTPYNHDVNLAKFVLPLILVIAVLASGWWACQRTGNRMLIFAFWWMLLTLVPALDIPVLMYGNFVRDRYLYLPSVGFVILVAAAFGKLPLLEGERPYLLRAAIPGALILVLGVAATLQQIYWTDDLALAFRGYTKSPNNVTADVAYADQLQEKEQYARSLEVLGHVFSLKPDDTVWYYSTVYDSIARDYMRMGKNEEARAAFETAELYDQNSQTISALEHKAAFYGSVGDFTKAIQICGQVLKMEPDSFDVTYNCGYANYLAGHYLEAEKLLRHAVEVGEEMPIGHLYLGQALLRTNHITEAEQEFRKTISLDSRTENVHASLAITMELEGRPQAAIDEYRTELAYFPGRNMAAAARLAALSGKQ